MRKSEILNLKQLIEKFESKVKEFERVKDKKKAAVKAEILEICKKIDNNLK